MRKLVFINSHPIQYFVPLYKFLVEKGIDCKAWYCSDESLNTRLDKEFGVKMKYDIPLLEGYESKFFKNYSWKPSHFNGFFGLINFGVIKQFFKTKDTLVIIHGWHYFTHFFSLIIGSFSQNKIALRVETPLNQEQTQSGVKNKIRRAILRYLIFPRIDYFLYIGKYNNDFFIDLGVDKNSLIHCPYAVDNERFQKSFKDLLPFRNDLRSKMGIGIQHKVILYSGKYIAKKNPLDLLKAFNKLDNSSYWLIMVGEGVLRKELEEYIRENNVKQVILTGFINQSRIAEYYTVADLFVMCSGNAETWGLSTNEAMNFNLPVVISDRTGCSADLVEEGVNGYTYPLNDIDALSERIKDVLEHKKLSFTRSSQEIINDFSYNTISENLKSIL
ncbi:glycosyltransferase family 4 protein [Leeuwenhoekiella sp. MAR_2009_132]|uniref:glycosyltransferase family 4 protein n=1 Tax=Leeuwenhoekiella sp. MAR_2009_132 TaxID=1392489 RepID=UPI0004914C27|nr:glycosyltransferase family 4 protein [Leeuwenhoekiella sp. MAR_2009_132]